MEISLDRKGRYDRIGYSFSFKKVARVVGVLGSALILLMIVVITFINMTTANIKAGDAINQIRYENIKHK